MSYNLRTAGLVPSQIVEGLKPFARAAGLWNLFLPDHEHGPSNADYVPLCEIMAIDDALGEIVFLALGVSDR